jgi:hypothetical protein
VIEHRFLPFVPKRICFTGMPRGATFADAATRYANVR